MQLQNEQFDNTSLNLKKKINESEDLRESVHAKYDALSDLNKVPSSLNESKPFSVNDIYNKQDMLTEQLNCWNN